MNNVLILGKGYVGSELSRLLNRCNVHFKSQSELDYHDQGTLRRYIGNNDIKYVINCAGFTGRPNVDECEDKKELCTKLNVLVPLQVAESCRVLDVNYIHISSGCIYGGYEKPYTEEDAPNFGFYDSHSSFYSKTKHLYEIFAKTGLTIRVRMPFTPYINSRNFLNKLINYSTILDTLNSKTYLPDLCNFIQHIIDENISTNSIGLLNFVNPAPTTSRQVIAKMEQFGLTNVSDKQFVNSVTDLNVKANRSNCVLSIEKLKQLFPTFYIRTEMDALDEALTQITKNQ